MHPKTQAELELFKAALNGTWCVLEDGRRPDTQGINRIIRADFLRYLASENNSVHTIGIRLQGAWITGDFDCTRQNLLRPISVIHTVFEQKLILRNAKVPSLDLTASRVISLDGTQLLCGDIKLCNNFESLNEIKLIEAHIKGNLDLSKSIIRDMDGYAILAQGIKVEGNVLLNNEFNAIGEVCFDRAQIHGDLNCRTGNFHNRQAYSLKAQRTHIEGSVYMTAGFRSEGEICLENIRIDENLVFDNASIKNTPGTQCINAANAQIARSVLIRNKFSAVGEISFQNAQIAHDFECYDATINHPTHTALNLRSAKIGNALKLFDDTTGEYSHIDGHFDLSTAKVVALEDAPSSWPTNSDIKLDDFEYYSLKYTPETFYFRLQWLQSRYTEPLHSTLRPQPYQQLALAYKRLGYPDLAAKVQIQLQKQLRKANRIPIFAQPFHLLFGILSGYGQAPFRILYLWLPALIIMMSLVFNITKEHKVLTPTTTSKFEFNAILYTADLSLPFINLDIQKHWEINHSHPTQNESHNPYQCCYFTLAQLAHWFTKIAGSILIFCLFLSIYIGIHNSYLICDRNHT